MKDYGGIRTRGSPLVCATTYWSGSRARGQRVMSSTATEDPPCREGLRHVKTVVVQVLPLAVVVAWRGGDSSSVVLVT
ncbi:hypothetical protein TNCV_1032041 [Trichonephila clavipes]|nr:hypothetical protein TNCV_1032041 [Trichonephila clavipes]